LPARPVPLSGVVDHPQQGEQREVGVAGRVDALQGPGDQTLERLARGADLAPALAGLDQVALLLEDQHVVAVPDDMGHPQPHERAQLLGGVLFAGQQLGGLLEQRLHELVTDGGEEILLAAEVVIERAGGQVHARRQLLHGCLVIALAGEHIGGLVDDLLLAAVIAAAQRRPCGSDGHGVHFTEQTFEVRTAIRYSPAPPWTLRSTIRPNCCSEPSGSSHRPRWHRPPRSLTAPTPSRTRSSPRWPHWAGWASPSRKRSAAPEARASSTPSPSKSSPGWTPAWPSRYAPTRRWARSRSTCSAPMSRSGSGCRGCARARSSAPSGSPSPRPA